ncbi:MAG: hypothetical protein U5K43_00045 [Halofilum sp. (in: g-proteobacteria)]|nr:hypothetical protein [Halofilum sp. (in: g-proteobacteria)]
MARYDSDTWGVTVGSDNRGASIVDTDNNGVTDSYDDERTTGFGGYYALGDLQHRRALRGREQPRQQQRRRVHGRRPQLRLRRRRCLRGDAGRLAGAGQLAHRDLVRRHARPLRQPQRVRRGRQPSTAGTTPATSPRSARSTSSDRGGPRPGPRARGGGKDPASPPS